MTVQAQPAHPLEDVFGIEPGSTFPEKFTSEDPMNGVHNRTKELVDPTTGVVVPRTLEASLFELEKEERLEDLHIDGQLETIHASAVEAFEKQSRLSQEVDPKFSARNAEVAAQYLNIALNAVNSRVDAKNKRQKIRLAKHEILKPSAVNNNVIVADRNSILESLFSRDAMGKIIDQPAVKEVAHDAK